MGPEKQNENPDKDKFEKQFENELFWDKLDKNAFTEIVWWSKFDYNLSKEENFKNAFNTKIDWLIGKNLLNLPEEQKQELKDLQKKANEWKDMKWLIESYKEIIQEFSNRTAESYKRWLDNQKIEEENNDKNNKDSLDFNKKLKESILKNQEIRDKSRENQKKEWEELKRKEWEEKWNPEDILKWLDKI